ncbi:hypothetical protein D3C73_1626990 [compost metagenome]
MISRNSKSESFYAGIGDLHRVDADHLAVQINKRAAAVTFINGRIGLDHFLLPIIDAVLIQRYRNRPLRVAHNARRQ